jgi:hypothetical protein
MKFGTWNIRRLYKASSIMTVLRELSRYRSDGRAVGLRQQENTHFYMERGRRTMIGYRFFVHKRIISAVMRVEFASDRISYIVLKGRRFHIIVLNVHASTEDKTDDVKDSFYEELESIFDKFPKYHMKMLLGDFSAKVNREYIFKSTIWNESLHEISNDNGVRVILPHLKISLSKVQCSHIKTFINILGCLQMGKPTIRLTIY